MEPKVQLHLLKDHRDKLNTENLHKRLLILCDVMEECFGKDSLNVASINRITAEYELSFAFDYDEEEMKDTYYKKALSLLNSLITEIERKVTVQEQKEDVEFKLKNNSKVNMTLKSTQLTLLKEYIPKLNNLDLSIAQKLDETIFLISTIFGENSKECLQFKRIKNQLIADLNIEKIVDNQLTIQKKANMDLLQEFSRLIKSLELQSRLEAASVTNPTPQLVPVDGKAENINLSELSKQKKEPTNTPRLFFNIAFWTLISSFVVGAYYLGKEIGNNKFDREKNEMVKQINQLEKDTTDLRFEIRSLKDQIKKSEKVKELNQNKTPTN